MLLAWKSTLVHDSQPIVDVVPKDLHPNQTEADSFALSRSPGVRSGVRSRGDQGHATAAFFSALAVGRAACTGSPPPARCCSLCPSGETPWSAPLAASLPLYRQYPGSVEDPRRSPATRQGGRTSLANLLQLSFGTATECESPDWECASREGSGNGCC